MYKRKSYPRSPRKALIFLSLLLMIVFAWVYYAFTQTSVTTVVDTSHSSTSGKIDVRNVIGRDLPSEPEVWKNATLTGKYLAEDLVQVCVDSSSPVLSPACNYFEYWTNTTGRWTLLGRYDSGMEGPSSCESFETWHVARGMSCKRWNTEKQMWVDSTVEF